jgi:hypothetical protein
MMAAKTRIPRTVHRNRFELASWGVWLERMINRKRMNSFLRFTHVQESTIQRQNEIDRFRPADQRLIDGLPSVGQMERLAVGSSDFRFQISDFRFQIWDSGFGIRDSGFGIWDSGFGIWDMGFGIFLRSLGMTSPTPYRLPLTSSRRTTPSPYLPFGRR